MTRTRKRKIKSITAELIACTLIAIAIFIVLLITLKIAFLVVEVTHLTYEQFKQAMTVVSIAGAIIAVIKLLREPRKE